MKVLLTTLGTTGDVLPFVSLARALAARGLEPTVCSSPQEKARFEAAGVRFVGAGPALDGERLRRMFERAARASAASELRVVLEEVFLADAEGYFPRVRQLAAEHDACVCHSLDYVAQRAAIAEGRPWGSVVFCPGVVPSTSSLPGLSLSFGAWGNRLAWGLADAVIGVRMRDLAKRLDAATGIFAPLRPLGNLSPLLTLVAASPALGMEEGDCPEGVFVTGAWGAGKTHGELPPELARFAAQGPVDLVVTFGSMSGWDGRQTAEIFVEAVRGLGCRAIIQRGAGGIELPLDGNDVLWVGDAPHEQLFAVAPVVVHHGGAGTCHAACRAGAVSVVVPHVQEQAYWAALLHRIGVAAPPLPRRRLTARALTERIAWARRSDQARARAQALSARLGQDQGAERAAELVHTRLGRGATPAHRTAAEARVAESRGVDG